MSYREIIDRYIDEDKNEFDLINDLYLSYPTLKLSTEDLILIRTRLHKELAIDYSSIKIIGSSHIGFSTYKNTEFSDESDIDIAIISERLFNSIHKEVIDKTKGLHDRSLFATGGFGVFKNNFLRGYIRDVHLMNTSFKVHVQRLCEDLSSELGRNVNIAFYLNEDTFRFKVLESIEKYKESRNETK